MWLDEIKLGFFGNLIKGSYSEKLTPERIIERMEAARTAESLESFGLFDSSTPNYTTYYPDVTAEDLAPNDEEFIYPTFRALSEVIVHKGFNPVDFSAGGILKKSANLLVGSTINPDHESGMVGNAVGAVRKTAWQEQSKADGGIIVPAGINAQFKIDGKSNPRIARGIMMDPPSIHSSSVTVQFNWDKSHPSLTDEEFFQKLSTYDKDGNMIRRMATKIIKYKEISLVSHGADPYAQKIGENGQINNPRYAATSYNSEAQIKQMKEQKMFFFDFKVDLIQNAADPTIPGNSNDNKTHSDMNPFLLKLAEKLGVAQANLTEEQLQEAVTTALMAAITAKTTAEGQIAQLTAQHTTEAAEIVRLTAESVTLKAASPDAAELTRLKAFEIKHLTDARAALSALYNKVTDNKPDAAIAAMIANSNLEACAALSTQYTTQLEAKFPAKCGKCGSTSITRASAIPGAGDQGGGAGIKSTSEAADNIRRNQKNKHSLGMPGQFEAVKK